MKSSEILTVGLNSEHLVWIIGITRLGCFYVTAIMSWGYGWGWVEVDIEAEVDLKLRLKWGSDEIESKFSWTWVEAELCWGWDKLTLNRGRSWAFLWVRLWSKICFRSTHVAKQHMFSLSPLILAFNFIQFKGNFFLAFWGKDIGYFEGWGQV